MAGPTAAALYAAPRFDPSGTGRDTSAQPRRHDGRAGLNRAWHRNGGKDPVGSGHGGIFNTGKQAALAAEVRLQGQGPNGKRPLGLPAGAMPTLTRTHLA